MANNKSATLQWPAEPPQPLRSGCDITKGTAAFLKDGENRTAITDLGHPANIKSLNWTNDIPIVQGAHSQDTTSSMLFNMPLLNVSLSIP